VVAVGEQGVATDDHVTKPIGFEVLDAIIKRDWLRFLVLRHGSARCSFASSATSAQIQQWHATAAVFLCIATGELALTS